jgi:hypothetical protein
MDEEKKSGESPAEDEEIDFELAMEAAREVSDEFFHSQGGVYVEELGGFVNFNEEELTAEELAKKTEEALKEMNVRVNVVYRLKKQRTL